MTLTDRSAIDILAAANRPCQLDLLHRVADHLVASSAITHLVVRGSLARGTSDRLSDVDLVVGVNETEYAAFTAVHNALIQTELGAIMPGWPDKIVPRMGGLGYVHLIEHQGKLHQLDLYLAPSCHIDRITQFTGGHLIYTPSLRDADTVVRTGTPWAADQFVAARLENPLTCTDLLVELLVLAWMIRKRIARGQQFMAYAEVHMLNTAARSLIRTALRPQTAYYGWYHLDTDIGVTPLGRACLRDLAELIGSEPVPTRASLGRTMERVLAIAHRAAPEAVTELRLSIDAFLYHFNQD